MSPAEKTLGLTESSAEILPSELAQIVESVFATMLGLEVGECGTPWFPNGERLTAAVHMAGRFLSMDPSDTVDDVVRDVLGELVNMIGGNMKCVLTRGIRLSMPSVVDGSDYCLRVCGAEVRERLACQCSEGPFWVTVLAMRS